MNCSFDFKFNTSSNDILVCCFLPKGYLYSAFIVSQTTIPIKENGKELNKSIDVARMILVRDSYDEQKFSNQNEQKSVFKTMIGSIDQEMAFFQLYFD